MTVSSPREEILGDVKRALRREQKGPARGAVAPASARLEDVVSEIRATCEQRRGKLIEQFEEEATRIGVHFRRAANLEVACQYIADVSSARDSERIVAWEAQVIGDMGLREKLQQRSVEFLTETTDPEFIRRTATADIGVSGVDYALADTGTLVLLSCKGQARSVSLLPPVHVAIVKPEQILSGLSDLFPLLRADANAEDRALSSAITFITGPSRTADIELTLVVGVHGPQELHVLLIEQ
jgi:L-lactate dehydrogenase complex protein LldG